MLYKLKVQIQRITNPPVWRRILIPSHASFEDLHRVIQAAFGWDNEHLYQFSKKPYDRGWKIKSGNEDYSMVDGMFGEMFGRETESLLAKDVEIEQFLNPACPKITYTYDFGDDWFHEITLEEIDHNSSDIEAHCIGAKGCCPPEDCGGPGGYMYLKEVLEAHPEESIKVIRQQYYTDHWDDELGPREEDEDEDEKVEDFEGIEFVEGAGPFFPLKDGKPDLVNVNLRDTDFKVSCVDIKGVQSKRGKRNAKDSKPYSIIDDIDFTGETAFRFFDSVYGKGEFEDDEDDWDEEDDFNEDDLEDEEDWDDYDDEEDDELDSEEELLAHYEGICELDKDTITELPLEVALVFHASTLNQCEINLNSKQYSKYQKCVVKTISSYKDGQNPKQQEFNLRNANEAYLKLNAKLLDSIKEEYDDDSEESLNKDYFILGSSYGLTMLKDTVSKEDAIELLDDISVNGGEIIPSDVVVAYAKNFSEGGESIYDSLVDDITKKHQKEEDFEEDEDLEEDDDLDEYFEATFEGEN